MSSLGAELGIIRGEGERRGMALEEAGRTRADLARERAGLMVQLTASERDNAALTEEVAAFRCTEKKIVIGQSFQYYIFLFVLFCSFFFFIIIFSFLDFDFIYCCIYYLININKI